MTSSPTANRDALAALRIQRPDEPGGSSRRRRRAPFRLFGALLILLALAGAIYALISGRLGETPSWLQVPEMIQSRIEVRVTQPSVERGRSADAVVVASGYLESRRQARIGARAPGRIEDVHVEEGTLVKKDQVLAVLEHADLDASLSAANASLARVRSQVAEQELTIAQAKREFDRATQLQDSNALSQSEFDKKKFDHDSMRARLESLKADVALAEARVRESEQLRENMFVRAPFDGTVISKDAEVGESIMPGGMGEASGRGSVVTIADLSNLEIDCDVKEDFISRIREGQTAEVAIDAVPDRRYQGRVRKIIPMGDRARATIKVKVEILDVDSRLFPEMSGTAYFLPEETQPSESNDAPRMFIPETAIALIDGLDAVWVVDSSNRTRSRAVTVGGSRDGRTEILGGLDEADRVVVDPADLSAGQLVKVLEN